MGDRILITRRGSMLARLEERDIIETGLEENDANVMLASTEINVHRAIYQGTAAQAIVHAHPPYAIARSLMCDEIVPIDSEGSYLLHKVPVVHAELTAGSKEVAELLPKWLKEYDVVMLRGHGPFAIGHLLEEAYQLTSVLEMSCRIMTIADGLQRAGQGVPQGLGALRDLVRRGRAPSPAPPSPRARARASPHPRLRQPSPSPAPVVPSGQPAPDGRRD